MNKITIDFESRSTIDLRKTTSWRYAEDPTTQIMCLALKVNDSLPQMYFPDSVRPLYNLNDFFGQKEFTLAGGGNVLDLLSQADIIEAHNVEFEISLWTHKMVPLGFPDLREEPYFSKLRCSASAAAAKALPRALGKAGAALNLPIQKDDAGHKLMLKMCKPRIPRKAEKEANPQWRDHTYYHETPEDLLRQAQYCAQDVNAEHCLSETVGQLPAAELEVWRLDQRTNWRGVRVDLELCRKMSAIREEYMVLAAKEFKELTGLNPTQLGKFKKWLLIFGLEVTSLDATHLDALLDREDLLPDVRRALKIRQAFAKTSLAKLDAAQNGVSVDGRLRSMLMYHGASTGRWTGKGFQLHNLPSKGLIEDIDACINFIMLGVEAPTLGMLYPDLQMALSSCIRGLLVASPGKTLYAADFSSIEGRVLAWLAGDQHIIQGYIDGLDMYKIAATTVFHVPYENITKDQRRVGKIPELGGGYQGGWRAYMGFAVKEKLRVPAEVQAAVTEDDYHDWWLSADERTVFNRRTDDEAAYCKWFTPIVKAWRANRPGTVALWAGLEAAAINAIENPGDTFTYGHISYGVAGGYLQCRLPSGRKLYYYEPRISLKGTKKTIVFMGTDSTKGGAWLKQHTYGGKLVENVTQAIARDLMAYAAVRIDKMDLGIDLLFTVHDELVEEGPEGAITQEQFEVLMSECPDWAAGCPVGAEGWVGPRYHK